MSIFGKKSVGVNPTTSTILPLFYDRLREMQTGIDAKKNIITIFAESKGSLEAGEVFSFGNGGREIGAGFVINFPGRILGIGLSSNRVKDEVTVAISINGVLQPNYGITLHTAPRDHDNFSTPLEVNPGDTINFVSRTSNATCTNTVVSLFIELI